MTIDGTERDALVRLFRDLHTVGRLPAELQGLASVLVDAVRLSARSDLGDLQERISGRKPMVAEMAEAGGPWVSQAEARRSLGVTDSRIRQLCRRDAAGPIARGVEKTADGWRIHLSRVEAWRASGVGSHAR